MKADGRAGFGIPFVLPSHAAHAGMGALEEHGDAEGAAGAPLAGETVAQGNALRFTVAFYGELAAMAGCNTADHARARAGMARL